MLPSHVIDKLTKDQKYSGLYLDSGKREVRKLFFILLIVGIMLYFIAYV